MSYSSQSDQTPNQQQDDANEANPTSSEILPVEGNSSQPNEFPRYWRQGLIALGILAILGGIFWGTRYVLINRSEPPASAQQESAGPQATPVRLQQLQSQTIIDRSQFLGRLEAQERVVVRPETQGRITEILVESGQQVETGMPIAQLEQERSQAQLRRAQADVASARSAVETARSELASQQSQVQQAQSELELQREEYQRTQFLVEQGAQSEQELDRARRDRDQAKAQLESAQQQVEAARSRLEEAKGNLERAQSDVEVIQEDIQDTRVVAPISGTVGDVPVKVGDFLQTGDSIAKISQNNVLELHIQIPTEQAQQLEKGLTVQLENPNTDKKLTTGQISFISPQVESNSQSVLAKAVFSNSNGRLRDDQVVRANVIWEEQTGVLVPTKAISRLGGQTFVFVAEESEEGKLIARQKSVELGDIQDNSYQVLSGLKAGETIITSGIMQLSDGDSIIPESQMQQMGDQG